jgi:hypothetical protein
MVRKNWYILAPIALFAMIAILRHHQVHAQAERFQSSYGRYTVSLMMARTEPLYRTVTARYGDLHWSAEPMANYRPGEPARSLWSIVCSTTGDEEEVWFLWDANTGHLLLVSHAIWPSPASRKRPTMRKTEAVASARRWMQAMGLAEGTQLGAPTRALRQVRDVWCVSWQVGDRALVLEEDAHTGDLMQLQMVRRKSLVTVYARSEESRDPGLSSY